MSPIHHAQSFSPCPAKTLGKTSRMVVALLQLEACSKHLSSPALTFQEPPNRSILGGKFSAAMGVSSCSHALHQPRRTCLAVKDRFLSRFDR